MGDLIDLMRREAANVMQEFQQPMTLVATSYNPATHAIKGILMPSEIESGWIPLSVAQAGNGYGILTGPKVGTADDLKGDQFNVHFEGGDQNTPVATLMQFSTKDAPPGVKSGEILIAQEKGTSILIAEDGSVNMKHASGGSLIWGTDGTVTLDSAKIVLKGEVHLGGDGGQLIHRKGDQDSRGDTAVGSSSKVYAV